MPIHHLRFPYRTSRPTSSSVRAELGLPDRAFRHVQRVLDVLAEVLAAGVLLLGLAVRVFLHDQEEVRALELAVADDRLARGVAPLEVVLHRLSGDGLLRNLADPPALGRLLHLQLGVLLLAGLLVHQEHLGDRKARRDRAAQRRRLVDDRLILVRAVEGLDLDRQVLLFGVVVRGRGLLLARRPLLRRGRRFVAALHDRALALLARRRRRLGATAPATFALGRRESFVDLRRRDPLRQLDGGIDLEGAVEALDRLVAVLEAGDVDRAQVDIGPGHDRVVIESGLLPRDQGVQQDLLGRLPLERVVVVESLLVHLNELLDRRLVLGDCLPGEHAHCQGDCD